MAITLDPASSEFYKNGKYELTGEGKSLTSAEMVAVYKDLVTRYPIISIEDGMAEDDWDGWRLLTETIGSRVNLVGDDLFVTNPKRLAEGIAKGCGNAILDQGEPDRHAERDARRGRYGAARQRSRP